MNTLSTGSYNRLAEVYKVNETRVLNFFPQRADNVPVRSMRQTIRNVKFGERGFTLPEVMITIAILGILLAIAMMSWNSIVEARRVETAANQLASDMRLAHTRATNQLTDWRVILTPGSADYQLVRLNAPYPSDPTATVVETITRSLPQGTKVLSTTADPSSPTPFVEFNSDGSIYVVNGPNGNVIVSSADGAPERKITYLTITSRIKLE